MAVRPGWSVRSGNAQDLARIDLVGIAQHRAVRLEDRGVLVRVAQVLLGDGGQGLSLLHGVEDGLGGVGGQVGLDLGDAFDVATARISFSSVSRSAPWIRRPPCRRAGAGARRRRPGSARAVPPSAPRPCAACRPGPRAARRRGLRQGPAAAGLGVAASALPKTDLPASFTKSQMAMCKGPCDVPPPNDRHVGTVPPNQGAMASSGRKRLLTRGGYKNQGALGNGVTAGHDELDRIRTGIADDPGRGAAGGCAATPQAPVDTTPTRSRSARPDPRNAARRRRTGTRWRRR